MRRERKNCQQHVFSTSMPAALLKISTLKKGNFCTCWWAAAARAEASAAAAPPAAMPPAPAADLCRHRQLALLPPTLVTRRLRRGRSRSCLVCMNEALSLTGGTDGGVVQNVVL